jgi:hypothetical protein
LDQAWKRAIFLGQPEQVADHGLRQRKRVLDDQLHAFPLSQPSRSCSVCASMPDRRPSVLRW